MTRQRLLGFVLSLSLLALPAVLGACAGPGRTAGGGFGSAGGPTTPGSMAEFVASAGDEVLFTTDSSELSLTAQVTLNRQAAWLSQYRSYPITIEGHADERGTREYNLALGARRAAAVRNYLASRGVEAGRIRTISFGKERPVATCDDISCWSRNRRAVTQLGGGR